VFTAAGLLLLLQREAGGLDDLSTDSNTNSNTVQYVDTLYFTLMTFATVGYGGDPPTTVLARLVVLALTAGFLIAVPLQVCVHYTYYCVCSTVVDAYIEVAVSRCECVVPVVAVMHISRIVLSRLKQYIGKQLHLFRTVYTQSITPSDYYVITLCLHAGNISRQGCP
jgi:Ion channel